MKDKNLIDAAPEMLEALKEVFKTLHDELPQDLKMKVINAIDKAEGRSPGDHDGNLL